MTRKLLLIVTALLLTFNATGCADEEDSLAADESFSTANYSWDVWKPVHKWTETAPNGESYEDQGRAAITDAPGHVPCHLRRSG